jgi:hypothetical protein
MTNTRVPTNSSASQALDRRRSEPGTPNPGPGDGRVWTWYRLAWYLVRRALLRPRLAADLLSAVWAFRRRDWYRKPPFLPLPPREYIRWRMYTAYGDEQAVPRPEDVMRFARWRREVMHL